MEKSRYWTEERIRDKIEKLDRKTNLEGAKLPIYFRKSKQTLGAFYTVDSKTGSPYFVFSKTYYHDPDWPKAEGIETIRHEYAHYMDYVLNGKEGHGKSWKKCCLQIGARPNRLYDEEIAEFYRKKEKHEAAVLKLVDVYETGMYIIHPSYGKGRIASLDGEGRNVRVTVSFEKVGIKKLGLEWLDSHCGIAG